MNIPDQGFSAPAAASLEAVRALSEGRAPKRFLCTIPVQVRTAAPAPADIILEALPLLPQPAPIARKQSVVGFFEAFRASGPGQFTTKVFFGFAAGRGYRGDLRDVVSFISRIKAGGHIVRVRKHGQGWVLKFVGGAKINGGNFAGKC